MKLRVLVVAAAVLAVLLPGKANAIPAFARKYNVACSTCHEAWPKLNDFGELFRDNGYQMLRGKDNPTEQPGAYWPIAFRTTVGYQYAEQEGVPVDQPPGTTTTKNGTLGFHRPGHPHRRHARRAVQLPGGIHSGAGQCLVRDRAVGRRSRNQPSWASTGSSGRRFSTSGWESTPRISRWTSTGFSASPKATTSTTSIPRAAR